ncbi:MAG: YfaZ family outer membrane protein [Spongiibacteraceae bacterium]
MKKSLGLLPLVVSALAISPVVLANDLTLRLSDEVVSVYLDPVATATNSAQLGLIYNDEEDGFMLSGGLFANGQRDAFSGRLGGKVYYADNDGKSGNNSGYGLALGGDVNYQLMPDLSLSAGAFFAPNVLAFSDYDHYKEVFIRANYQVFETASVGFGYSTLRLEPEDGRKDIKMEDGLFVEMRLQFR